jgi:4'-phosphopantetheinyl transferase
LATRLLGESCGGTWTIEPDARGKPLAVGPSERHLSIAHSRNVVAAAITAIGPIGIDVERHDRVRDHRALADAAFGPSERRAVAMHGARIFYRTWTMREAVAKATGEGLGLVVDGSDRTPPMPADGAWMRAGDWLVIHDLIDSDLGLAIAVRDHDGKASAQLSSRSLASLRVDIAALVGCRP